MFDNRTYTDEPIFSYGGLHPNTFVEFTPVLKIMVSDLT